MVASQSDREVAHIERYESHKLVRQAIRSIRVADVFSSLTLSSDTQQQEGDASHMVRSDGWSLLIPVPPLIATSRRVTFIWDHFGFFQGLILDRLSSRRQGMKACVECHAGQTHTLNPPLQSNLFVDACNHAVSSEKNVSLKSL